MEREPTSKELQLWERAEKLKEKSILTGFLCRLKLAQIVAAAKHAQSYQVTLNLSEMPDLEKRMMTAINEIEKLRKYHCDVNGLQLGVSPSSDGNDLDIVSAPAANFGAIWIPIAIGAVIVAGIIARWAYLEQEVSEISAKYNGVIDRADMALCQDTNSAMCQSWEKSKATGDYYKREGIIEKVEGAVKRVGGVATKGLGWGISLAVPLLLFMYAPRRKG